MTDHKKEAIRLLNCELKKDNDIVIPNDANYLTTVREIVKEYNE